MGDATPALVIEDLHKRFGDLEVLKGVSLTARVGDVIAMIGASGSGKSTLLRCINLLETPDCRSGPRRRRADPHAADTERRMPCRTIRSRSTASARSSAWCSRASICGPT